MGDALNLHDGSKMTSSRSQQDLKKTPGAGHSTATQDVLDEFRSLVGASYMHFWSLTSDLGQETHVMGLRLQQALRYQEEYAHGLKRRAVAVLKEREVSSGQEGEACRQLDAVHGTLQCSMLQVVLGLAQAMVQQGQWLQAAALRDLHAAAVASPSPAPVAGGLPPSVVTTQPSATARDLHKTAVTSPILGGPPPSVGPQAAAAFPAGWPFFHLPPTTPEKGCVREDGGRYEGRDPGETPSGTAASPAALPHCLQPPPRLSLSPFSSMPSSLPPHSLPVPPYSLPAALSLQHFPLSFPHPLHFAHAAPYPPTHECPLGLPTPP